MLSAIEGVDHVWHYTSAEGLTGLLQGREIWASGIDQLNDPTEVTFGYQILEDAWQRRRDSVHDGFVCSFVERVLAQQPTSASLNALHVFSASQNGDSLPMWQQYAKTQGFAVRIHVPTLLECSIPDEIASPYARVLPRVIVTRVIYDSQQQQALAELVLDWLVRSAASVESQVEAAYPRRVDDNVRDAQRAAYLRGRADGLGVFVRIFVSSLKNQAFEHESEIRLIVDDCQPAERQFRSSGGRLVPYVRLAVTSDESSPGVVAEVRCGPSVPDHTMAAVRSLLASQGRSTAIVSRSTVPYRT